MRDACLTCIMSISTAWRVTIIPMQFRKRVTGCFKALAAGDALGKQTEMLSRTNVQRWYPGGITGFHGRPGEVIPRYAGKRYEWRIGETTDDTEQTLRSRERSCGNAGPATRRSGTNFLNARNPFIQGCHCGPSPSAVNPHGSLRLVTAVELPCAQRQSACCIHRAAWMS